MVKFDYLVSELAKKQGDEDFQVYSPEKLSIYINKAMLELFNTSWVSFKNDVSQFLGQFPELLLSDTIDIKSGIGSLNGSVYKITQGLFNNKLCSIKPNEQYSILKTATTYHLFNDNEPALIQTGNNVYVFPTKDGTLIYQYIWKPIRETGNMFEYGNKDDVFFSLY